ncbi:MAG: hypothetical protein EA400_14475 [Chromatiaceae bacterium]|nr:MAG: hypothetical protein EA400_14475 [Chromatiaceae bacterium]
MSGRKSPGPTGADLPSARIDAGTLARAPMDAPPSLGPKPGPSLGPSLGLNQHGHPPVSIAQASGALRRSTEVIGGWAGAWAGCKIIGAGAICAWAEDTDFTPLPEVSGPAAGGRRAHPYPASATVGRPAGV